MWASLPFLGDVDVTLAAVPEGRDSRPKARSDVRTMWVMDTSSVTRLRRPEPGFARREAHIE